MPMGLNIFLRKAPEIDERSRNYPGCFSPERTAIWPGKSQIFPAPNTASMKSPEPIVSLPTWFIWIDISGVNF